MFMLLLAADLDPLTAARETMVRTQIADRGVTDVSVANAMLTVKRHLFVPEKLRAHAYEDRPLPIGYGQTISQPYIVAYMTALLRIKPGARVLEIGTGSGYQAAILACLTREVYSIEVIPELGHEARERLSALGFGHVRLKIADGYYGWTEHAPFDAIIVTAAAEYIPPPLIRQLKSGGRMVIPVGSPMLVQNLMLVNKNGTEITTKNLLPVRFVPLRRGL